MSDFILKYKQYLQKYTILNEGSFNSILPYIQNNYLKTAFNGKRYNELSKEQQKDVDETLIRLKDTQAKIISEITDNQQYQSWLYDVVKSMLIKDESLKIFRTDKKLIKRGLADFQNICKSPLLDKNQKNIMLYTSIDDLFSFIDSFKEKHTKYLMNK